MREKEALVADVWNLAVAEALSLMDWEQADRIVLNDTVEIRDKIEVYSLSPDDPAPKLLSRLSESERKPRLRTPISQNLQTGHIISVHLRRR